MVAFKRLESSLALTILVTCSSGYAQTTAEAMSMKNPQDIAWVQGPLPNIMVAPLHGNSEQPGPFTFRVKLAANSEIAPHTVPVTEYVTVVSGTFYLGQGEKLDGSKATALAPGAFAVTPAKMPHFVLVKEETVIQIHGNGPSGFAFVNPGDAPSNKK
jgi:hypothetical protein